ncbi:lipopolysaccharide biosynthesis protein [Paenibacillus radicis (ex Xue et al. 2023)]|uniref:Oligosaccharide flippase family protein n=1 Tax=Paenibacillus radicis (ex Xue et al. 2023) TaxID=2972489 RepID=A0ABT1YUI9_9BACL|nr:oligosaccharide flippase family protein [Paenibacillus radicis (ex Xue et al. 2023)]MCR8635910.1 oligosaccharide flippase family protein [Paenibacillus radicis (ex Xue et al. 2023)]
MQQPINLKLVRIRPIFGLVKALLSSKSNMANTIRTMLFSILILGVNMLTGILTARFLGPTGRGEQTAMVLWSQFLAFSFTFGIPSALIYNVKKNMQDSAKLYTTALWMGLAAGTVAMAAGILFLPYWLRSYSPNVVLFSQWSMLFVPLIVLSQINNAMMQVRGEYKLYNRLRFLIPLSTLACLGILILSGTMHAYTSAVAYLAPAVPFYIWTTMRLVQAYQIILKDALQTFKRLITYGIGSYGNDLMGNLSYYIDQIVIVGLLNPAQLGLYAVAVSLSRVVNVFSTSIIAVLFPKASGLPKDEVVMLTFRVFRISTCIAIMVSVAIMVIAPFVLTLLYGNEFKEALGVFRLLLLEVSISGGTMVLAQAFMALGKPKVVTILQGLGLLLVIPMLLLLVPKLGLTGAGIAMLSSVLIRFLFILINVRYTLKMKIPRLLITREDVRWLLSALSSYKANKSAESRE